MPERSEKKNKMLMIIAVAVILAVAAILYFVFKDKGDSPDAPNDTLPSITQQVSEEENQPAEVVYSKDNLFYEAAPVVKSESTEGDFEYQLLDDGTVRITGYIGKDKAVTLPNVIDGYEVKEIGPAAFYGCGHVKSVSLPESVGKIGYGAFYDCKNLETINLDNITNISGAAFVGTPWLEAQTDEFVVVNNVLVAYKGKATEVTVPDGIKQVSGFFENNDIKSVTLPNSVTLIGDTAFSDCDRLAEIVMPDSVTKIGYGAFWSCKAIKTIKIGSAIKEIGACAFRNCIALTEIDFPDSVTVIGDMAFSGCSALKRAAFTDSITSIGENAFQYCDALKADAPKNSFVEKYFSSFDSED